MLASHKSGFGPTGVIFCAFFTFAAIGFAGTYSGGSGTAANPYKISTMADWQELIAKQTDWNKHFILLDDINFGGATLTPVGRDMYSFMGVIQGNGHVLRNANLQVSTQYCTGVIGFLGDSGEIHNLGVENMYISPAIYSTCFVGILCGENAGIISKCFAIGTIDGGDDASYVGGLCGLNGNTIIDCYSNSTIINGESIIGGLVGNNNYGKIIRCYSIGRSMGSWHVGGLCGTADHGYEFEDTGNFWDTETSKTTVSTMGTGKTTIEMQSLSTYTMAGWDFTDDDGDPADWQISANDYPRLCWEKLYSYSGGSGTNADPFRISTVSDWQMLIQDTRSWDKYYVLINDIDFKGVSVIPVALDAKADNGYATGSYFNGTFDGNGYILSNIVIYLPDQPLIGLFSVTGDKSRIQNLHVSNITVTGRGCVGGLCGHCTGTIAGCSVEGRVEGGGGVGLLCGGTYDNSISDCTTEGEVIGINAAHALGGLCGSLYGTGFDNCHSSVVISGGDGSGSIGGLCGDIYFGHFNTCSFSGQITVGNGADNIGGLCGSKVYCDIDYSHASCIILGGEQSKRFGGLCGLVGNGEHGGDIRACYATGTISSGKNSQYLGGLCGYSDYGNISASYASVALHAGNGSGNLNGLSGGSRADSDCFWDIEVSGITSSVGGTGKTTQEMKTLSTYTDAGWDFEYYWGISEGEYPCLVWEHPSIYSGGIGTESDPWQISTVADWEALTTDIQNWKSHYILTKNIDFEGGVVRPVLYNLCPFNGLFDGRGHILRNGVIQLPGDYEVGLFCHLGKKGKIMNFGVRDFSIRGGLDVGILCGLNEGDITGCYTTGIINGGEHLGGLCGMNNGGTIRNCYALTKIQGNSYCYGFCGCKGGKISHCYSVSNLFGTSNAIKFGYDWWRFDYIYEGNYWDTLSAQFKTDQMSNGVPTNVMKTLSTYISAGWDFVGENENGTADVWRMCGDGVDYPRLSWEFSQGGDIVCPDGVGMEDLVYLAGRWMKTGSTGAGAADADGSGKVDLGDFVILSEQWMK